MKEHSFFLKRVCVCVCVFFFRGGGGGGDSLKDTGISLQILAPTLEKALFWTYRQDFLT